VPDGHVDLRWAWAEPGVIELRWSEDGGPVVRPPSHRGFGSRLLERGLARGESPTVSIDYRPEGLRWTIRFRVSPA
jgi:two-component sensor histidine kinase